MSYTIRLIGAANGIPTHFDGEYVVAFDPPPMKADGSYGEGFMLSHPDRLKAKRFPDALAAFQFWRTENGLRPDGKPNRPLTAWTIEVEPLPS